MLYLNYQIFRNENTMKIKNLNLPSSWKDISLKFFSELDAIMKNNSADVVEKDLLLLSYLSGRSCEEILALSLKARNKCFRRIQFLGSLENIHLKAPEYFILKRKIFRLILNASELSGGQYIDLMTFLRDGDRVM